MRGAGIPAPRVSRGPVRLVGSVCLGPSPRSPETRCERRTHSPQQFPQQVDGRPLARAQTRQRRERKLRLSKRHHRSRATVRATVSGVVWVHVVDAGMASISSIEKHVEQNRRATPERRLSLLSVLESGTCRRGRASHLESDHIETASCWGERRLRAWAYDHGQRGDVMAHTFRTAAGMTHVFSGNPAPRNRHVPLARREKTPSEPASWKLLATFAESFFDP